MRRMIKAAAAASGLALALSACGSGGSDSGDGGSSGSGSTSGGTLVVWADNSANTAKAIEPLCKAWAAKNGVTCTVKKFNDGGKLGDALTKGNSTGDVPDIFEGAHNSIGGQVNNGILAPIDLGAKKSSFNPASVDAVTYDGNVYGVPWAVENVAMMTNKALSPQCPSSLDDAVANAKKLIAAGKTPKGLGIALQIGDTGDSYHWYPLYTADGGATYKRNSDGTYDTKDVPAASAGSIKAGNRLQSLVKQGILKASVSFDIARQTFGAGKSPYFITGPWEIPEEKGKLGNKLMICPVPNWKGSSAKSVPYLGIRAFFEPAKAKNKVLAQTFLNDAVMSTDFMDGMYATDPRPPAWTESYQKAASDPIIKGFGSYGADGTPMPNVPQQDNWFSNMGLAEYKIATGQNPAKVLKQANSAIAKANAKLG